MTRLSIRGLRMPLLVLGACFLASLLAQPLVAIGALHAPLDLNMSEVLVGPSLDHPFGTDGVGRDVLSRLLNGGRRSLTGALVAAALAAAIGISLGGIAGASPTWLDTLLARLADVVIAVPALVGALLVLGLTNWEGPFGIGVAVGCFAWPTIFRLTRAEVRRHASSDLALAATSIGASRIRLALKHLAPLAWSPLIAPIAFLAGGTILVEAGLGFLGLGVQPPDPSWGSLLRDGWIDGRGAWWLLVFPGAMVFTTVLSCHSLARRLQDRTEATDVGSTRVDRAESSALRTSA